MKNWPKLSETLPHSTPGQCQRCESSSELTYWQECDENDRPEIVFVVLCKACADAIIEPHPRLYKEQLASSILPGAMPICIDCKARDGMACRSPIAKFNGGDGLKFEPEGQMVHLCRSPRSKSGWHYLSAGPVEKCNGKEAAHA